MRPLEPLALAENRRVRLTLDDQAAPQNGCPSGQDVAPADERRAEFLWLAKESAPYAGQWVAPDGDHLVAHVAKLAAVSATARAAGVEGPLLARVPAGKEFPFGGWQAMHPLEFTRVHSYANNELGVRVPVGLRSGAKKVLVAASIDTGASFYLFGSEVAGELGSRTANSTFESYGHETEISVLGIVTCSMIYFFADSSIVCARVSCGE